MEILFIVIGVYLLFGLEFALEMRPCGEDKIETENGRRKKIHWKPLMIHLVISTFCWPFFLRETRIDSGALK